MTLLDKLTLVSVCVTAFLLILSQILGFIIQSKQEKVERISMDELRKRAMRYEKDNR